MAETQFQIAQVNIARMLAPLDDPLMAEKFTKMVLIVDTDHRK